MNDTKVPEDLPTYPSIATPVAIVLTVLLALVIGGCLWLNEQFDDDPPSIGAPYDEGEVFLVMEALAGEIIAALPSEGDSPRFSSRTWKSSTCTWGWNDHNEWDGLVSVSIAYEFPPEYLHSEATGIEYAELIIAKLEELNIEPEVDHIEKWSEKRINAVRDDGLTIRYNSHTLYIIAGCVTDDGSPVYTPPHGGVPPAGDQWLIE